jgi:hypothetical protein
VRAVQIPCRRGVDNGRWLTSDLQGISLTELFLRRRDAGAPGPPSDIVLAR